ncbi:jg2140 [Pararge aegeria aegeria]|uniref:Jg2140 protein n=1 Tax=Pararge aegeria aegeria TaxID=348720 RepID=A0A8S4RY46_9NEOP|nr:jg2140 [Pararge aegeria aegeria]
MVAYYGAQTSYGKSGCIARKTDKHADHKILTIRLLLTTLPTRTHNQCLHCVFAGGDEVPDFRHSLDVGLDHGLGGVRANHRPKPHHRHRRLSRGHYKKWGRLLQEVDDMKTAADITLMRTAGSYGEFWRRHLPAKIK